MSGWIVALDPIAVAPERTELSLNSDTIQVDQTGIDWGQSEITPFLTQGKYGEPASEWRVPNRTVTIPLFVGGGLEYSIAEQEETRRHLQEKVALIQREGGVLLRRREGGEPFYADIITAALTVPDVYGETGGIEPNVNLVLTCLPDFYGSEITLDAIEGEGQIDAVLQEGGKQAIVAGDYPARAWIVVTNPSTHDQHGVIWGLRSRHYTSSATGSLVLDASKLTPLNGAKEEALTGAYESKVIGLAEPRTETWHPFLSTDLSATKEPQTHVGSYKVWARIYNSVSAVSVRLSWSLDDATAPTYNKAITIPEGVKFFLVDLGNIQVEEPPTGTHFWRGIVEVWTGSTSRPIYMDRIWLNPLDECAGGARASTNTSGTLIARSSAAASNAEEGKFYKYSFASPAVAVAYGIEVKVEIKLETSGECSLHAQLLKNLTTPKGEEKVNGRFLRGGISGMFGGSSDLWGTTWTSEELAATEWGVHVWVTHPVNKPVSFTISGAEITVYEAFAGTTLIKDAVCYAGRNARIGFDGAFREGTASESYVAASGQAGDLFRLSPSGLEKRPVELFVKATSGIPTTSLESGEADSTIDQLKAQVVYRPCYIGRI